MLKIQKPYDMSKYLAVDPIRVNELHLLGFAPEYLFNNKMYFLKTIQLEDYLLRGIKPRVAKEKKNMEKPKKKK